MLRTNARTAARRQGAEGGTAFSHSEADKGSVWLHCFISVSAVATATTGLTCSRIQSAFGPALSSKSLPAASRRILSYNAVPGSAICPISRCTPAKPSLASTCLANCSNSASLSGFAVCWNASSRAYCPAGVCDASFGYIAGARSKICHFPAIDSLEGTCIPPAPSNRTLMVVWLASVPP